MHEDHCISPRSINHGMGGISNNLGGMRSGSPRRVYSPRPLLQNNYNVNSQMVGAVSPSHMRSESLYIN